MAATPKVIDAEIIEERPARELSRVEVAARGARTIARALDRLGVDATRANDVAEALERAQATADATGPVLGALDTFARSLEKTGILRFTERPRTLGKKA